MKILVTALEPYEPWNKNSSWESLVYLLSHHGVTPGVTTRRYPSRLRLLREKLAEDLNRGFDVVLHLGQLPGASQVLLECISLNVAGNTQLDDQILGILKESGPVAYRTQLPMERWAKNIRQAGIPAKASFHAGIYLCNAMMYLSQHWYAERNLPSQVGFIHLPLTLEQAYQDGNDLPGLKISDMAQAINIILKLLTDH